MVSVMELAGTSVAIVEELENTVVIPVVDRVIHLVVSVMGQGRLIVMCVMG